MKIYLLLLSFVLSSCFKNEDKVQYFDSFDVAIHANEHNINFQRAAKNNLSSLEVVPIQKTLDSLSGLLFFIYEYPVPKEAVSYTPLTMSYDRETKSFTVTEEFESSVKLAHPRGATFFDFNDDALTDLVIADHGHDVEPFLGEKVSFFKRLPSKKYERLNFDLGTGYWFSSCESKKHVLLISTGTSKNGADVGPTLIHLDSKPRTLSLNSELSDTNFRRYLSCIFMDVDHDGDEDLIMGAMDRSHLSNTLVGQDFLFENDGHYQFSASKIPMPEKFARENWASIDFSKVDMNGDGILDLVSVSHNHEWTSGVVEVFKGGSKGLEVWHTFDLSQSKQKIPESFFILRAYTLDLDGNGRRDLVFHTRQTGPDRDQDFKSSVHLYLQNGQGGFVEASELLTQTNEWLQNVIPVDVSETQMGLLYIYDRSWMKIFVPNEAFYTQSKRLLQSSQD